tara:strand:- start:373 stop:588 length:216 start_codon:yes stop_codon:yes gene_type:complete
MEGLLIMSLMEMISEEPFHHDHRERMRDYLACSVIWPFVMVFFIVASICMIPPLLAELSDYVIEKKKGDRK